jgi:hypothetical protein
MGCRHRYGDPWPLEGKRRLFLHTRSISRRTGDLHDLSFGSGLAFEKGMKVRHAAALALVLLIGCGTEPPVMAPELPEWEIMLPPQIEGRPGPTPDETAPLSKWVVDPADRHNYPTQNECEQKLKILRDRASACPPSPPTFSKVCEQLSNLYGKSRCVSIDDPAIKSN